MASRKDYSNGITWKDVARAWHQFELSEGVSIEMRIVNSTTGLVPNLEVSAKATLNESSLLEAPYSVSASATCLGTRLMSLEAVLFHLLYVLDFQSAAAEYVKEE